MENRSERERSGSWGVVATLEELVELRVHARRGIDLAARRRSGALLAGPYLSPFRGRGMDFDEVRAYQPGDDVRTIDWRVTARTGSPYSKIFHEERERPVWLLVDARPTMHFGTRCAFKSVVAARAAALVAWAARDAGDRVGALVDSGESYTELSPGHSYSHLYRLLGAIAAATLPRSSGSFGSSAASLQRLGRLVRTGSRVIVLSDFYGFDDGASRHLAALARRSELTCVFVHDALEAGSPPQGRYRVTDGRAISSVDCPGRRWEAWTEPFTERRDRLASLCQRHRIQLVPLRTDEDPRAVFSSKPLACARAKGGRSS